MHYQDALTMSPSLWTDLPVWLGEDSLQAFDPLLPIYTQPYTTHLVSDPMASGLLSLVEQQYQHQTPGDAVAVMSCYQDPIAMATAPPSQLPLQSTAVDPVTVPLVQPPMSSQSTPVTLNSTPPLSQPSQVTRERKRTRSMPSSMTEEECTPRPQKPRYKDDMYSPRWVRYSGHLKEGYCETCPEGRWLQLKNSAYWYHKQFYHGISSVTGMRFAEPLQQRIGLDGPLQGLCHQCGCFVPICNGKKRRNNLLWYKHAHKCHVYIKPEKFNPPPF